MTNNNNKSNTRRSDLQTLGYASSIPLMPIAGTFIGYYIGQSFGGEPYNQIFALIGGLLFFFISVFEFINLARKEHKSDIIRKKDNVIKDEKAQVQDSSSSFSDFLKKAKLQESEKQRENLETLE